MVRMTAHDPDPARRSARGSGRPGPRPAPPEISVVVPVFRSAATLHELLDRVERALEGEDFELIAVVDGSPDDSLAVLLEEVERRPRLVVIELARNFGQHAALCAGFAAARGAAACVLDADLQLAPEELPRLLAAWRDGHDLACGRRIARRDGPLRRLSSFGLNVLARRLTHRRLSDWGCPLAVIDAELFRAIPAHGDKRRFLKPLVAELSRDPIELDVAGAPPRGPSSYSGVALLGVALDFVVAFSTRPFQRLAGAGVLAFAAACLGGAAYAGLRVTGGIDPSPHVPLALVALGLLGMQAAVLGLIGVRSQRVSAAGGAPLYVVARTFGAGGESDGSARDRERA